MKTCWVPVSADPQGNYLATPGGRYAGLLSVDSRASVSDAVNELNNQGFQVTYSWQSGQPTRGQFFVDNWLANLPAPTPGTVWMYFELDFTGDVPRAVARSFHKCILWICGTGTIAYVFEAQQVPDNYAPCGPGDPQTGTCAPLPPPAPGCPPEPNPWKPVLVGVFVGGTLVGLVWLVVR